jgi:hypothetical protein
MHGDRAAAGLHGDKPFIVYLDGASEVREIMQPSPARF